MNRPVAFTKPASNLPTSIFSTTLSQYLILSMLRKLKISSALLKPRLICYARLLESTKETGFDVKVKKRARVCFQH